MKRVGIYAGTFDPIHAGHISFARGALQASNADAIFFLPERVPRHKPAVSSYEQRVAEIRSAIADDRQLQLIQLPDDSLSVHETLPELEKQFPDASIILLVGSDVVAHMHAWPEIDRLLQSCELAIGMRDGDSETAVTRALCTLTISDAHYRLIYTAHSHVSSTAIRKALT